MVCHGSQSSCSWPRETAIYHESACQHHLLHRLTTKPHEVHRLYKSALYHCRPTCYTRSSRPHHHHRPSQTPQSVFQPRSSHHSTIDLLRSSMSLQPRNAGQLPAHLTKRPSAAKPPDEKEESQSRQLQQVDTDALSAVANHRLYRYRLARSRARPVLHRRDLEACEVQCPWTTRGGQH